MTQKGYHGNPAKKRYAAEVRDLGEWLLKSDVRPIHDDGTNETADRIEGIADAAAALWVAACGQVFANPGITPPTIGTLGQCFANATQSMRNYGLSYVEGFAGPHPNGDLWVLHAWNVDDRGRVIDCTWPTTPARHYFGVRFNTLPKAMEPGNAGEGKSVIIYQLSVSGVTIGQDDHGHIRLDLPLQWSTQDGELPDGEDDG